ncbi:hypothetical protein JCGZ_05997 [Jatropha curcas]|uniref:Uncharacterized protein n=1 Tax=Jatropha curcas TaxID=180498 RepID=A0A067KRB4_JATCU|nr:hypothetical protein JCGZ_05997 [Jatropha curcas]
MDSLASRNGLDRSQVSSLMPTFDQRKETAAFLYCSSHRSRERGENATSSGDQRRVDAKRRSKTKVKAVVATFSRNKNKEKSWEAMALQRWSVGPVSGGRKTKRGGERERKSVANCRSNETEERRRKKGKRKEEKEGSRVS